MDYDFSRFSTSSFQEFIQLLCVSVFGPGLQVYGLGPDGARDATYEGKTNYPSPVKPWDGYVVIQAKYRERPAKDLRDADWLVQQIKKEQEKFERNIALRRPEFYLVASNVVLSPLSPIKVAGKQRQRVGGLAKVELALNEFKTAIGCKACDVWHSDKLSRLIDLAPVSLKSKSAAWITPSELIWSVLSKLGSPNFATTMALAIAHDLREHRSTRLQDAGHTGAESTLLSDVFMDLPVEIVEGRSISARAVPGEYLASEFSYRHQSDSPIEYIGDQVILRAASACSCNKAPQAGQSNRIVLLGGPGQGKSTVGQFLVQLYQARLLLAPNAPGVSAETTSAAQKVLEAAGRANLKIDTPYRIPMRLFLPSLADRISDAQTKDKNARITILEMMATQIERLSKQTIALDDVREWLGSHPWIIVLDGLDEVPRSSAMRAVVLQEISALFDELAMKESDTLVIVTTRPQGYREDLDSSLWDHWTLRHLQPKEAISYARNLATIRLADTQKQNRVIKRLAGC